jgi:hypothetical protein
MKNKDPFQIFPISESGFKRIKCQLLQRNVRTLAEVPPTEKIRSIGRIVGGGTFDRVLTFIRCSGEALERRQCLKKGTYSTHPLT